MHDCNGTPLAKGDKVLIPAVITDLYPNDDFCNVSLESTLGRRPDNKKEHFSSINTAVLLKAGVALLLLCSLLLAPCSPLSAQTPALAFTAGPAGITAASNSPATWKQYAITSGSAAGTYQVVWAESNGTAGGIYTATVTVSAAMPFSPSAPGPVPPTPPADDLPLAALSTAVSASLNGVDPATAAAVANAYESMAQALDAGTIVSPLQLNLATSAQLLALSSDQLGACKGFIGTVSGWLDAQQCTGRLSPDHMERYARTYHAIAAAVKQGAGSKEQGVKSREQGAGSKEQGAGSKAPKAQVSSSPCANGHCPVPQAEQTGRGRRRQ